MQSAEPKESGTGIHRREVDAIFPKQEEGGEVERGIEG